jgi:uncharacterized protein (DUF2236 family)
VAVAREDLEAAIAALRREVRDPRAGLFGPGTVSWRVHRDWIVFLAGGRAALLQLAHPLVAHAVAGHSQARGDPLGRFRRTFAHVFAMSFGDLDGAVAAARRVHGIHARVRGTVGERVGPYTPTSSYEANDPETLLWVHATLLDSAVRAFELVVRPLAAVEREQYLGESRRFARLFGIPESLQWRDWASFAAYNERMWRWLRIARPAKEIAAFLLRPPALNPAPLAAWYRTMTAGLVPEPVRVQLDLAFGLRERLVFATSVELLRGIYRALPARLRELPAHADARRRLAGKRGRDLVGRILEKLLLDAPIGAGAGRA